jgi:hypothetical protein
MAGLPRLVMNILAEDTQEAVIEDPAYFRTAYFGNAVRIDWDWAKQTWPLSVYLFALGTFHC